MAYSLTDQILNAHVLFEVLSNSKKFPKKEKRGGWGAKGKRQNKTIFKPHQQAFHYDMIFIYKTRKKMP